MRCGRAGLPPRRIRGGAGNFRMEHARYFEGVNVTIIQDRDEPGRRHAAQIHRMLLPLARSVRVVEAKVGNDVSDHLEAVTGLCKEELDPPIVDGRRDCPVSEKAATFRLDRPVVA